MKRRYITFAVLLLLVLILVLAMVGPASAAPVKTSFTSTWTSNGVSWNWDDWHGFFGKGGVWHMDNFVGYYDCESSYQPLSGPITLYGASRWLMKDDEFIKSEWTGKYTSYNDEHPDWVWAGSWTARTDITGAMTIEGQGIGKFGDVAGLVVKWSGYTSGPGDLMHVTGIVIEK